MKLFHRVNGVRRVNSVAFMLRCAAKNEAQRAAFVAAVNKLSKRI